MSIRTDMALERRESLENLKKIDGIGFECVKKDFLTISRIEVLTPDAASLMGKPCGKYITIDLDIDHLRSNDDLLLQLSHTIAKELRPLLPPEGLVLMVGLGNRFITSDALGPLTLDRIIVTRHLQAAFPDLFASLHPTAALSPGVMGKTGLEAFELVRSTCRATSPSAVIAVDALAAASLKRLGGSFQISTGGIIPGEGAGNHRHAIDRNLLGIPVISLGVPTVTEARTLAHSLLGHESENDIIENGSFLVSPSDIDLLISRCSKALAYGINLALHGDLSVAEMEQLIS
ncbi:MAG: GPR endopeptidase [Clostridia bacterium]|nr:GPR endopeptidase [Clostridia bacterium]MBQ2327287.1 GPR endopeptidase [Clostridia bacterium]